MIVFTRHKKKRMPPKRNHMVYLMSARAARQVSTPLLMGLSVSAFLMNRLQSSARSANIVITHHAEVSSLASYVGGGCVRCLRLPYDKIKAKCSQTLSGRVPRVAASWVRRQSARNNPLWAKFRRRHAKSTTNNTHFRAPP